MENPARRKGRAPIEPPPGFFRQDRAEVWDIAEMTPAEAKLYVILKTYADYRTGVVHQGVRDLARVAGKGLTRSAVSRALESLKKRGKITVDPGQPIRLLCPTGGTPIRPTERPDRPTDGTGGTVDGTLRPPGGTPTPANHYKDRRFCSPKKRIYKEKNHGQQQHADARPQPSAADPMDEVLFAIRARFPDAKRGDPWETDWRLTNYATADLLRVARSIKEDPWEKATAPDGLVFKARDRIRDEDRLQQRAHSEPTTARQPAELLVYQPRPEPPAPAEKGPSPEERAATVTAAAKAATERDIEKTLAEIDKMRKNLATELPNKTCIRELLHEILRKDLDPRVQKAASTALAAVPKPNGSEPAKNQAPTASNPKDLKRGGAAPPSEPEEAQAKA